MQEYLTSNEAIAYPFRENAAGLAQYGGTFSHGPSAVLPRDFFLDMVMVIPSGYWQEPVCLAEIRRTGASSFDFIFRDAVAIVLSRTYSLPAFAEPRTVIVFSDISRRITLSAVIGPSFDPYLRGIPVGSSDLFGSRLPLETAVVEAAPRKLRGFRVGGVDVGPDIRFEEGYNIGLTAVPAEYTDYGFIPSRLTIAAGGGLGRGRLDPCSEEPVDYIGAINGQQTDDEGEFYLTGDGCITFKSYPESHIVGISNECIPCCTCEEYAAVVKAMELLFASLRAAMSRLKSVWDGTIGHINEWNDVRMPGLFKLQASLTVTPGLPEEIATGRAPDYARIDADVVNRSLKPTEGAGVTTLLKFPPGALCQIVRVEYVTESSSSGETPDPAPVNQHAAGPFFLPVCGRVKIIYLIKNAVYAPIPGVYTLEVRDNAVLVETVTFEVPA